VIVHMRTNTVRKWTF